MKTDHNQVDFINPAGHKYQVDEGLLDILNVLSGYGVYTQYSCQGTKKMSAYILADKKSFMPVLQKILRRYNAGVLSAESSLLVSKFLHGYREIEWLLFINRRDSFAFRSSFHKGQHIRNGYALERTHSIRHGSRITVRFPTDQREAVLKLLEELK